VGCGLAIAFGASRLVSSLLYGIAPHDPVSYAVAATALLVAAGVAGWLPAIRAAHVDPATALRREGLKVGRRSWRILNEGAGSEWPHGQLERSGRPTLIRCRGVCKAFRPLLVEPTHSVAFWRFSAFPVRPHFSFYGNRLRALPCDLAKVGVASSSLVSRSNFPFQICA